MSMHTDRKFTHVTLTQSAIAYTLCATLTVQPVFANVVSSNVETQVIQAGNGVPVVNIAKPTESGLSHNQFQHYNVTEKGLILNNSTKKIDQSQLGGLLQNNPNFDGQAAKKILNEVVGANASQLHGYTEVFGQSADVIVANPYGISCNGCGFINTPNVTLSTGTPNIVGGDLTGFNVEQGNVAIVGQGLDATHQDYFSILSRTATLQGEINANNLAVVTGKNKVEYGTNHVIETTDDDNDKPTVAVDASALGGMYAGRISLVATEKGVGVNLADVATNAGDIVISADGKISLSRTSSAANAQITSQTEVVLSGQHYAAGSTAIKATEGKVTASEALVSSGNDITLTADIVSAQGSQLLAGIQSDGTLASTGSIKVKVGDAQLSSSTVQAVDTVNIETNALSTDSGSDIAANEVSLKGSQTLKGEVNATDFLSLEGDEVAITGTALLKANTLTTSVQDTLTVDGDIEVNQANIVSKVLNIGDTGKLSTSNNSTVTASQVLNNDGRMLSGANTTIDTATLTQNGDLISERRLALTAEQASFTGLTQSGDKVTLSADGVSLSSEGTLLAGDTLIVNATTLENSGQIAGGKDVNLTTTETLTNAGQIESHTNVSLDVATSLTNSGDINTLQTVEFASDILNANGNVNASDIAVTANELSLLNNANWHSQSQISVDATSVTNRGELLSDKSIAITANSLTNESQILANDSATITTHSFSQKSTGAVKAGQDIQLTALNELAVGGKLNANQDISLSAGTSSFNGTVASGRHTRLQADTVTLNGTLSAAQDLMVSTANDKTVIVNQNGVLTGGNATVNTGTLDNRGRVFASGSLKTNVKNLTNSGALVSLGDVALTAKGNVMNSGLIYTGRDLDVNASGNVRNTDADIIAERNITISGLNGDSSFAKRFDNLSGYVEAGNNISVAAETIKNSRRELKIDSSNKVTSLYPHNNASTFEVGLDTEYTPSLTSKRECYGGGCSTGDGKVRIRYSASPKIVTFITEHFSNSIVASSAPAQVVSNRNLQFHANTIENNTSVIHGNRNVSLAAKIIRNIGVQTGTYKTESTYYFGGSTFTSKSSGPVLFEYQRTASNSSSTNVSTLYSTISAGNNLSISGSKNFANSVEKSRANAYNGKNTTIDKSEGERFGGGFGVTPLLGSSINLPSGKLDIVSNNPVSFPTFTFPSNPNGLFIYSDGPDSQYLIETNPVLTNLDQFYGSDYFFDNLSFSPAEDVKLLGDAYYDTRIISQAIFEQTGKRYLTSNVGGNLEQMKQLLDNATLQTAAYNFTPGVALTANQINQLTHSMVWYEPVVVNGQEVLAPKLYLANVDEASLAQIASVSGNTVNVEAGDISNSGSINATSSLTLLSQNEIANVVGEIVGGGDTTLTAKNDIRNISGLIAGDNVSLTSESGNIINQTFVQQQSVRKDGTVTTDPHASDIVTTQTEVGDMASIQANGSLILNAGKSINNTAAELKASGSASLNAKEDIVIAAEELLTYDSFDGYRKQSTDLETSTLASNVSAAGDLAMNANNDIEVQASTLSAGETLALVAGNDLTLEASQNRDETLLSESGSTNISKDLSHQGTALSGNNVSLDTGGDISSIASTITASDDVTLKADGDVTLLAANDSQYRYSRKETKKSFGRKKVEINESLKETVVGADIRAGNNISVQAGDGVITKLDESKVSVVGSALNTQGDMTLVADGDVTIQAQEYREFSRHETIKKGFGGLSSKQSVDATSKQSLDASELLSAQNIMVKSGEDLQVLASNVTAGGGVNLEALDEVLIAAGEIITRSEQWTKESSFFSGGDLYSQSFDLQGEEHTTAAQSQVQSGGNLTVNAGSIKVVGSELDAGESVALKADTGNVDILAAKESHTTYEEHERISISAGDVLTELMDTSNYTDSLESGQAKITLAKSTYDKVDTRTDETTHQGSSLVANSDVAIDAVSDINIEGSTLIADAGGNQSGDLTLKAGDSVRITDVINSSQTQTEETHGKAEVSVVVQHQAVEVAKAAQALQESAKALKQAKNDYRQYKKQLDTLNTTLSKLEQELVDNQPGVTQADIIELKGLIADVKGDEAWYISGIALAAVDVTSKTTALVQQTAAAAQSTVTYGFNAGIQLDIEGSKTQTESRQTTSQASQLAGNNIVIQAGNEKGNEATIKGSHLVATDSFSIASNEVNLLAAQETSQSSNNNKAVSGSIQATVYGATSGISINLSGSESESQSSSTTHINSTLTADNIAITSIGNTTVRGANVDAESELALKVGGDLNVESVQDRHSSNNKSRGVSAGVSLGGGEVDSNGVVDVAGSKGNVTGANGGLNAGSGRTYQTDTVLTSLTAGESATINVDGHTQINGALIATVDEEGKDAGNLTLDAKTLGFSDLKNTTYAQNSAMGISTSVGIGEQKGQDGKPTGNTEVDSTYNSSTLQYQNSSNYSVTKTLATLGKGNVTVGGDSNSDSLTALNRDVENTEKDLFTVERNEGSVDVTVDHRLLTEAGRNQISLDLKRTSLLGEALGDVISEDSVKLENTLEHIDVVQKELDVELLLAGSNGGEALVTLNNLDTAEAIDKQSALSAYAAAYAETFGISIESATVIAYSKFVKGVHISGSEGATIALNDEALNNARDYMETLGHEVTHALIDQGVIKPRDSYTAEEEYASLIGEYAGDNYAFALERGGLGEIREGDVNANLGNAGELVSKNTVLAIDQLSKANPSDVKFSLDRNEVTQLLEARKGCSAAGAGSPSCVKVSELLLLDVTRDEARREACSNPSSAACKTAVLEAEIAYNSLIDGASPFEDVAYGQELSSIQSELDDPSGELREQSLARIQGAFGLVADFTPGVGDVKGFAEAQSGVDYLLATVGLVPVVGDLVKKAADALNKGDIGVAKSLLDQAKLTWHESPKLLEYKPELPGNQLTGGTDKSVGDLATGSPVTQIKGNENLTEINQKIVKVDTSKAVKGSQEHELLNNPLPDSRYVLDNGTTFKTNSAGFVEEIIFTPIDLKMPRDSRQTKVGKEGLSTDVGGHIQACSMGGTCHRFNLFPQDSNFNNSAYKVWENEIREYLQSGDKIAAITVRFRRKNQGSSRPDSLVIKYTINGEAKERRFKNEKGVS